MEKVKLIVEIDIRDKFTVEVEDKEDDSEIVDKLIDKIRNLTPEESHEIFKNNQTISSIVDANKENITKKVIDQFDPMLLEPGDFAPEDEYDGESRRIAKKIEEGMSASEIAGIISKEMTDSFSTEHTIDYCMSPAKEIHYLLNE